MTRHWNYRIVRRTEHYPDGTTEDYYAIHEVYYAKDGKPRTMTANPVAVVSETPAGIAWHLRKMRRALKEPVLDYEEIVGKADSAPAPSSPGTIRLDTESDDTASVVSDIIDLSNMVIDVMYQHILSGTNPGKAQPDAHPQS